MDNQTTAHTHLAFHHTRHEYKRGQYKGDAPADAERRGKSHYRVIKNHQTYTVRFHYTDIITAYPDGTISIDTRGWHSSPTTRAALNQAFNLCKLPFYLSSTRLGNLSQPTLYSTVPNAKPLRYYDGMMFDAQHNLITERKPFQKRLTNRDETREFRRDAEAFRAMLPILHAGCDWHKAKAARYDHRAYAMQQRPEDIFTRYDESAYPDIVAMFYADTWQETWRNLYRAAAQRMKMTVDVPLI
jgi:hypothetical protein